MNALAASILILMMGCLWLALSALANEPRIRVTAAICGNKECSKRGVVAFEPVRIDVEAFVPRHDQNRVVRLGLVCDGEPMLSAQEMDGRTDPPVFNRTYRDVLAGECIGVGQVIRADGSQQTGKTGTLTVRSRFQ